MGKNTGKVREIYHSENVGTMVLTSSKCNGVKMMPPEVYSGQAGYQPVTMFNLISQKDLIRHTNSFLMSQLLKTSSFPFYKFIF